MPTIEQPIVIPNLTDTIFDDEEMYLRWYYFKLKRDHQSESLNKVESLNPFWENRRPEYVASVLFAICRYGFRKFMYCNIKPYLPVAIREKRNHVVSMLQTLGDDGFLRVERCARKNRSEYYRCFSRDEWKDVYRKVVKG